MEQKVLENFLEFEGKTAVVTGACGGIGSAIVRKLCKNGARVACVDREEGDSFKEFAESTAMFSADVSDEESVKETIEQIKKRFGQIDILINAAGVGGMCARTEEYVFSDFKRIYEINVFGTFLMMKYVLPVMQKQQKGAIVNFGSVSGQRGYPYEIGYGSSKWAVIGMTKNAACENGKNGVRINSVSPGWVDTNMMKKTIKGYRSVVKNDCMENVNLGPMERPAKAEEIAHAVLFLCSDKASYLNGTDILVDGGKTLE